MLKFKKHESDKSKESVKKSSRRSVSPKERSRSPSRRDRSPSRRERSPSKRERSPNRRERSPRRHSPDRRDRKYSPERRERRYSPDRRDRRHNSDRRERRYSPDKRDRSPQEKRNKSPPPKPTEQVVKKVYKKKPSYNLIEIEVNDRLGTKARVKCSPNDLVGDFKKLVAAQIGTTPEKIVLKKWYKEYKDHISLSDYELHDGMNIELYYK